MNLLWGKILHPGNYHSTAYLLVTLKCKLYRSISFVTFVKCNTLIIITNHRLQS